MKAKKITTQKKPQCTEEQLLEVKEAFNVFDSEQTGGLDARELKAAISALNIKISKDEIRQIYQDFGKDIREKITQDEFMEIVIPRLPDRHTKEYIQKIFQYFDLENTGKITVRHLKKIAQENYIKWHPEKTNTEYLYEISNIKLKKDFEYASYLYTYIWYGKFEITDELYNTAQNHFKSIIKKY